MARTAKTFEDKIQDALEGELSATQEAFVTWIEEKTDGKIEIDRPSLILTQRLYNDYLNDPEVKAANEERRAANKAKAQERQKKSIDRAMKLLAEAGVTEIDPAVIAKIKEDAAAKDAAENPETDGDE